MHAQAWKDKERKQREEEQQVAAGLAPPPAEKPFSERFSGQFMKERLIFGGLVSVCGIWRACCTPHRDSHLFLVDECLIGGRCDGGGLWHM